MTSIEAAVLGLVQGVTEFLPISSTAHLRIVPALLGWSDPGAAFSAVIQLGTLAAVLVFFRSDLLAMVRGAVAAAGDPARRRDLHPRLALYLVVGTIPVVVAGVVGYGAIAWLIRFLGTRSTLPFVIYRVAVGLFLLGWVFTH